MKMILRAVLALLFGALLSACGGTMQVQKRMEGQVVVAVPTVQGAQADSRSTSCVKPGSEVDDGETWAAGGTKAGGTHEVSGRRVFRAEKGTAYGGSGYGSYFENGTRCYYLSEVEAVKARDRR
jgi:hypothetical protein